MCFLPKCVSMKDGVFTLDGGCIYWNANVSWLGMQMIYDSYVNSIMVSCFSCVNFFLYSLFLPGTFHKKTLWKKTLTMTNRSSCEERSIQPVVTYSPEKHWSMVQMVAIVLLTQSNLLQLIIIALLFFVICCSCLF
jgi:hypothetical protein